MRNRRNSRSSLFVLLVGFGILVLHDNALLLSQEAADVLRLRFGSIDKEYVEEFTIKRGKPVDGQPVLDVSVLHQRDGVPTNFLDFQLRDDKDIVELFDGISKCLLLLPKVEGPDIEMCISLKYSNGLERILESRTTMAAFQVNVDKCSRERLVRILHGKGRQTSSFEYLVYAINQVPRFERTANGGVPVQERTMSKPDLYK